MPDHLHVVLQGNSAQADVWRAMVLFKQRTGFWLKRNSPGTRWQKDFFDRILHRDEDLIGELRYIALNPVRGGLAMDWRKCSFLSSDMLNLEDLLGAA